jgi:hypothetical protein
MFCAQTYFQQYRGRRVPFSCFARSDSFSAVPRAFGPVFMFCAPGLMFGGTEGFGSRFHVLCSRTCFRPCRVCRVPFLYFANWYSLSAVPRASGPVSMFCAPETRFRRYRGRRLPFSCISRPDLFSAVARGSGPVFMFCTPRLNFDRTVGVGIGFHILRARTHFRRYRRRRIPF